MAWLAALAARSRGMRSARTGLKNGPVLRSTSKYKYQVHVDLLNLVHVDLSTAVQSRTRMILIYSCSTSKYMIA